MQKDDVIYRQMAIDVIDEWFKKVVRTGNMSAYEYDSAYEQGEIDAYVTAIDTVKTLPAAQPELTDEQSIAHLQSSGWMQRHDKEMYESGLKEQLADDSDSYDSLLPTVQPEIIRCEDCKFSHMTNDGKYCKYCDMFTDDYGQLIEMYFESNFYCGYAERKINERTG